MSYMPGLLSIHTLEMNQPFHAVMASSPIFKFIGLDTPLIRYINTVFETANTMNSLLHLLFVHSLSWHLTK